MFENLGRWTSTGVPRAEWHRLICSTNRDVPLLRPRSSVERFEKHSKTLLLRGLRSSGTTSSFDRVKRCHPAWVMMFGNIDNIRDVIAFPKTQKASDLLTGAPADVDSKQLRDLHIKIDVAKT